MSGYWWTCAGALVGFFLVLQLARLVMDTPQRSPPCEGQPTAPQDALTGYTGVYDQDDRGAASDDRIVDRCHVMRDRGAAWERAQLTKKETWPGENAWLDAVEQSINKGGQL